MRHALRSGFTLVEMLVVLAIMGIAASVSIPSIMDMRRTGSESRAAAALKAELIPACLQFQNMYSATRDVDLDLVGDFPLHPACLAGGQAGLNGEIATASAALTAPLLDRSVWGNASASWYTSQMVNLRLPGSGSTSTSYNGTLVDGYAYGFLTGGTPNIISTATFSGLNVENSLRDVMITVFATPTNSQSGHRSFAMSINPFYYRSMLTQTIAPAWQTPYQTYYLSYPANLSSSGMFFCPAGLPLAATASAATGGVTIPGAFRLNTTVAKPMQ